MKYWVFFKEKYKHDGKKFLERWDYETTEDLIKAFDIKNNKGINAHIFKEVEIEIKELEDKH